MNIIIQKVDLKVGEIGNIHLEEITMEVLLKVIKIIKSIKECTQEKKL